MTVRLFRLQQRNDLYLTKARTLMHNGSEAYSKQDKKYNCKHFCAMTFLFTVLQRHLVKQKLQTKQVKQLEIEKRGLYSKLMVQMLLMGYIVGNNSKENKVTTDYN